MESAMRRCWVGLTAIVAGSAVAAAAAAAAGSPATLIVSAQPGAGSYVATGAIAAVRQGTVGAQVSGRVTAVLVRNGDVVKAG